MKGKTFLGGAFAVLAVLAAWLVYMTNAALERERGRDSGAAASKP